MKMYSKFVIIAAILALSLGCSKPKHASMWSTVIEVTQFSDGSECYKHPDTGELYWFVKNTMPPRREFYHGGDRSGYIWEPVKVISINMMKKRLIYKTPVVLDGTTGAAYINADGSFTDPKVLRVYK